MENKKNNFLIGALIIAISHVLVKIIGAVYKIPLDRFILTTTGMGIYSSSYTIYNWLFVVSTAGLPVAISKLVSEARAVGKEGEARKIFRVSLNLLIFVGMIAFLIMFLMAVPFAKLINAESSYLTMMVMAPSLFFVAVSSSFRGYFQGHGNMLPTAIPGLPSGELPRFPAWSRIGMGCCSWIRQTAESMRITWLSASPPSTGWVTGREISVLRLCGPMPLP